MSEQNPMIEKLRKLIAHERSARSVGNLHEAEAFAAKVQDLLTAHKLDMSEVDFQAREEGEPIDWERVSGDEINHGGKITKTFWRQRLACTIAKINCCMVVNTNRSSFSFVGRTSDRQIAKILFLYLVDLGEELCAKSIKENRQEQSDKFHDTLRRTMVEKFGDSTYMPEWTKKAFSRHMKDYRESWKVGFGKAIHERLQARYDETMRAQANVSANAIVHIKRDTLAVQAFLKGKTRRGRATSINTASEDGFVRGHSTGQAVNLSPHTFGTTGRGSRLLGS